MGTSPSTTRMPGLSTIGLTRGVTERCRSFLRWRPPLALSGRRWHTASPMSDLRLYNTLTREKETFVPLVPGEAKIYSCGPTVYGHPHIGNLRTFLWSDLLRRY